MNAIEIEGITKDFSPGLFKAKVRALDGVTMQIARQPGRRTCAGLTVDIRRHLDCTHTVRWGTKLLGRYSAAGRSLSIEPIVHPATATSAAVA